MDKLSVGYWCSIEAFTVQKDYEDGSGSWGYDVSGHQLCRDRRWHIDHHNGYTDCCFFADDTPGPWSCGCGCHG